MTSKEITVVFEHCLWPNLDYWIENHPETLDSIKAAFFGTGPKVIVRTSSKNKEGVLEIRQGWVSLKFLAYWASIPELVPLYTMESQRSVIEMIILCWLVGNTKMHYEDLDRPIGALVEQSLSDYELNIQAKSGYHVSDFGMLMYEISLAEESLIRREENNASDLDSFIIKMIGLLHTKNGPNLIEK